MSGWTSLVRRSVHAVVAGLLLPAGLVAMIDTAGAAEAEASVTAILPAVPPLQVTVTKVGGDPRYGDPLLLDVTSSGSEVVAIIKLGNVEIASKPINGLTRFEIPPTGFKVDTEYKLDVIASNDVAEGLSSIRFTPQKIVGTVTVPRTTISYSAPLSGTFTANQPTSVVRTGDLSLNCGHGSASAPVGADGAAAVTMGREPGTYSCEMLYFDDPAYARTGPGTGSFVGNVTVVPMPTVTDANLSASEISQGQHLDVIASVRSADPLTTVDPPYGGLYVDATPAAGGESVFVTRALYNEGRQSTIDLSSFAADHSGDWVIRTTYMESAGSNKAAVSYAQRPLRINASTRAVTSTKLTVAPATVQYAGTAVQATAEVKDTDGTWATGDVEFTIDGTQVVHGTLHNGITSVTLPAAAIGAHQVVARFAGNATQASSTSLTGGFTVTRAATSVDVASSTDPVAVGDSWGAYVDTPDSSVLPSGEMKVMEGDVEVGTLAIVEGTGTFTVPDLTPGIHTLTVRYVGSAIAEPSEAQVTLTIKDLRTATTSSVSLDRSSTTVGGPTPVATAKIAVVGGEAPDGAVAFLVDGIQVAASHVGTSGIVTAAVPAAKVGNHAVTVRYEGNAHQAGSSSTATSFTVTKVATVTAASSPSGTIAPGTTIPVAVTAPGSSITPTGAVTVREAGRDLGTVQLTAGRGTFRVPVLAGGVHQLTFAYAGDGAAEASQASARLQVAKASARLRATVKGAGHGRVRIKVVVTSGRPVAGRVDVRMGKRIVARGTLRPSGSTGRAVLTTKRLPPGPHRLVVRYSGTASVNAAAKAYHIRIR